MKGEIYSLRDLEALPNWRATFQHVVSLGSQPRAVCLLKRVGAVGYQWKMPEQAHVELADVDRLHEAVAAGRLTLVRGRMPARPRRPAAMQA